MAGKPKDVYFQEKSPLGITIRTTKTYWQFIVREKHPSVRGHEHQARLAIKDPDEIRQSRKSPDVYLYYKRIGNVLVCVAAVHENGTGYIITAYLTDRVKMGLQIWRKP